MERHRADVSHKARVRVVGIAALIGVGGIFAATRPCEAEPPVPDPAADAAPSPGQRLYAAHCAVCHGDTGDGQGLAARFLYPKPRDFRQGRFRLVRSSNGAPTREDLQDVLLRGMPGSSMPSWAHLPEQDLNLLVDEVIRLFRNGVRDRYVAFLKTDEELTDEEIDSPETQATIRAVVDGRTIADVVTEVPDLPDPDAGTVARGREWYIKQTCHSCHGTEGKGDAVQKMVDDEGFATRPRDLTRGLFKGGYDPASLYRRIVYGMPGTPMPASKSLTPQQAGEMIHYLLSLSTEETRQAAVLRRRQIQIQRVRSLPASGSDDEWQAAPAESVQTFALWWRDNAEPRLTVQALHDGKQIAFRLTWHDESADRSAFKPDEFEDMAALELFRGAGEPFLGMGSPDAPIDLWQWRAGRKPTDFPSDEYPFETPVYRELLKGQAIPDFITARAGGNPLAADLVGAGNLAAKGPGSTTFRPRASQVVTADSDWLEGRWVVVFTRPLTVEPEAGLSLEAGQKYSAAFALWDGKARDRGPQKQVSIWHDLVLR